MPRWHFEDIKPGEVTTYGDRQVTREDIVSFAAQYDPQPFHLDEEAAKRSMLGELIASGWHSAALLMRMNCDGWMDDSTSLGAPGIEEMRWVKPVRPGDRLSVRRTVLDSRVSASRPGVGVVRFLFEMLNQAGDVVLTQQNPVFFSLRDAPAPKPGSYDAPPPRPPVAPPPRSGDDAMGLFFEDISPGEEVQLGAFHFDREAIVGFARQFDPQPFHLDEEAAARSPFGRLAASGWQTASVWMRLMLDARARSAAVRAARGEATPDAGPSPGYRDLRWLKPVYVGDTVSYVTKAVDKRMTSRKGWGVTSHESAGFNQYGEKVFSFASSVFTPARGG